MTVKKPCKSDAVKPKRLVIVLLLASGLSFAFGFVSQRFDRASLLLPNALLPHQPAAMPIKAPAFPELPLSRYKELGPILPALAFVNGKEIPQLGFVTDLDEEKVLSGLEAALKDDYKVIMPHSLGSNLPRLPVVTIWPRSVNVENFGKNPLEWSKGSDSPFQGAYVISLLKIPEKGTIGAVYKMNDLASLLMHGQQTPEAYKFLGELDSQRYFSMSLTVRDQALDNHLIVTPLGLDETWHRIEPLLAKRSYQIRHKTLSLGRNMDGVATQGANTLELIAEKPGRTLHLVLSESIEIEGRALLNVHETMPLTESEYFHPKDKQLVKSF